MLCPEVTEPALVARDQVLEGVWVVEVAEDEDKWVALKQEQVQGEIVCVHNAEQKSTIPEVHPVLI
jgi:hypothetical protein